MKMQIESTLHDMIGKTFMFKNNNHKILRYKLDDITAVVVTDFKDISFPVKEAKVRLQEFLPVDEVMIHHHSVPDSLDYDHAPMAKLPDLIIHKEAKSLGEIIMQNIKAIQDSPTKENMAKAEAINDQVKSLLDICKIEVEAMKVAAFVHKVSR